MVWTIGSGEGIGHAFVERTREGIKQHTESVYFAVSEIDTLTALGNRQGATLLPELRRAWTGERLGFGYADKAKRLPVLPHHYRMVLVVGAQPARCGPVLYDSDGGTPQRFFWLPAVDPYAPDNPPMAPEPWAWKLPRPPQARTNGRVHITVPESVRAEIDDDRVARLRGKAVATEGHDMLGRLKIAAALALLDGRYGINEEDWWLAGKLQAVVSNYSQEHRRDAVGEGEEGQRGEGEGRRAHRDRHRGGQARARGRPGRPAAA